MDIMTKRQIVLDTETTGLNVAQGNRVIEIGCVELINRRLTGNDYHQYVQPDRESEAGALEVHGITGDFLADKPRFEAIAKDFIDYIDGAELIIHNAPFDVGFLNMELGKIKGSMPLESFCQITDSLLLARKKHPGARVSLDALCGRYGIDNSKRTKHGALLDAEILADVFLMMTGGQSSLSLDPEDVSDETGKVQTIKRISADRPQLKIVVASADELETHGKRVAAINEITEGKCLWPTG